MDGYPEAPNHGAAPNAGVPRQVPIQTPLTARVGELFRYAV
jgi:hypothetical protein